MAISRRFSSALKTHRIPLAVAASLVLHAAIMSGAYVAAIREPAPSGMAEPDEQGAVELLPVEMAGVGEPVPANEPEQQPDQAEAPTDARAASAAAEQEATGPVAEGGEIPPPAEKAANDPGPSEREAPQPDAAATAARKPAEANPSTITFNLGGTDSLSSAIVQGSAIIPAQPDDKYRNRPPLYPRDAVRQGQGGAVVVVIHVSPSGSAAGADILESSGHPSLDRAALDAVLTWRFRPAMSGGRTVAFDMPMRFVFEPDNRAGR